MLKKIDRIQNYIEEDIEQLEEQRVRLQLNESLYNSPIDYEADRSYITGRLKTLRDISSLIKQLREENI